MSLRCIILLLLPQANRKTICRVVCNLERRIAGVFCTFLLLFSGMIFRLYQISQSSDYASAANNQSSYLLEVDRSRGKIYDCNFHSLVDNGKSYLAAVTPCPEAAGALYYNISKTQHEQATKKLSENRPFVMPVRQRNVFSKGVDVFTVPQRYGLRQLAPHIIGYLGADRHGVTGIEQAYDDYLEESGGKLMVRYTTDTLGRALEGRAPETVTENYNSPQGVVLTLDRDIQEVAESAAAAHFEKGAVVVLDVHSGAIRAMASLPSFDPNHISRYLEDENAPLINRALWPYSVGSTFKTLVAATAVERGLGGHTHYCNGSIKVGDVVYHCHNRNGHGELNMTEALEKSCNPYFISLIQEIGGESVAYKAATIGFGKELELADGLTAASGRLPTYEELRSAGETANFGFGQGYLTATPLQIAQLMATIANNGAAVTPKLVEGFTEDGATLSQATATYSPKQVVSERAALAVQRMMVSVVENGSGKKARPALLGAGGKTASAQTGAYDADGSEIIHAWFGGFYPADDPQYAIVVLAEGMDSGGDFAAPVFKEICDRIALLEKVG